jgi:hypothetical protein
VAGRRPQRHAPAAARARPGVRGGLDHGPIVQRKGAGLQLLPCLLADRAGVAGRLGA